MIQHQTLQFNVDISTSPRAERKGFSTMLGGIFTVKGYLEYMRMWDTIWYVSRLLYQAHTMFMINLGFSKLDIFRRTIWCDNPTGPFHIRGLTMDRS